MARPSEAARPRHVREKGVIDHLAEKVFEPMTSTEPEPTPQDVTTGNRALSREAGS
jgi:hypothetical protein